MLNSSPNHRIAVEAVLIHEGKILLTKRSDDCIVSPGVWSVPAGKAKHEENPKEALFRETREEVNLNVEMLKELDMRFYKGESTMEEDILRVVYTYLVKPANGIENLQLNDEYSEYEWVNEEELLNDKYDSLQSTLSEIIIGVIKDPYWSKV